VEAGAQRHGQDGGWARFYEKPQGFEFFLSNLHYHREFLAEIFEAKPSKTLEAGSGPATMSVFLAMAGIEAVACDLDATVLERAGENAERWNTQLRLLQHDIFALSELDESFDVVFSQGVLEHYSDEDVRRLAQEALAAAPVFVFSVPSRWYGRQDFGDERLLEGDDWARMLDGVGTVRTFEYMQTRLPKYLMRHRPLMVGGVVTR
jgi:SAM-dependent methyltransferase